MHPEKRTMLELPDKSKGFKTKVTATATETTTLNLNNSDGNAIGISVSNYATAAQWAKMLMTLSHGGEKILENVPMDMLVPSGERFFFPFPKPLSPTGTVEVTITDDTSGVASFDKTVLILHYRKTTCNG